MKYGNTKYWLDAVTNNRCVEVHIRWDSYILHKNCETRTITRHRNSPVVQPNHFAIYHDALGFGAQVMPKTWELWYNVTMRRLCISLWFIAFWFDFSTKPFFKKKLKTSCCLTSKEAFPLTNVTCTGTPLKALPKKT